jgi:hypothetical protein
MLFNTASYRHVKVDTANSAQGSCQMATRVVAKEGPTVCEDTT